MNWAKEAKGHRSRKGADMKISQKERAGNGARKRVGRAISDEEIGLCRKKEHEPSGKL